MASKRIVQSKTALHLRNNHRNRYDFMALIKSNAQLAEYVNKNQYDDLSIDFSNPEAVKELNKSLLKHFYNIEFWNIPAGYLCPPIPGRADYIHYLADLLAMSNNGIIPRGKSVRGLDIGVGANCVYPVIGNRVYGWQFVGADIDPISIKSAKFIVESNANLQSNIQIRLQNNSQDIFKGIVDQDERFDFTLCNPPFHSSLNDAMAGTQRKISNLKANASKKSSKWLKPEIDENKQSNLLNFGGQKAELWCEGGELTFINMMIKQSTLVANQCFWFTTLVSKKENLKAIYQQLKKVNALNVKTFNMSQGQKQSRFVAWTFLNKTQQQEWKATFWNTNKNE